VTRLEAERDCTAVLSRYGYYSDHGRRDEWVNLWTEDGVFDHLAYYGDDILNSEPHLWQRAAITGHRELHDLIYGPGNASIVGRSQHVAAAGANSFRLVDGGTAVMVTYSIVYVKQNLDAPVVSYQNHGVNRWTFRKIDGQWYIAENVRRKMGDATTGELLKDF
jgi:hypothetical protein